MTVSELDTFYFKFKNLVLAEKNATLTLKSEAGRTDVTLSVDLGHLLADAGPQQPHHGRNGPARRRWRERRAAARCQEAVEASKCAEKAETDDAIKGTEVTEEVIEGEQNEETSKDATTST